MDPQACWQRYLDACEENDNVERFLAVADLHTWYRNGGFQVKNVTLPLLSHIMSDLFDKLTPDEQAEIG